MTLLPLQCSYCQKTIYRDKRRINESKKFRWKIYCSLACKSDTKAAQNRFGSWNSAIKAAGFSPNPVKFAKKYIANDCHKCDSLAEKIIDDWLFARNIKHERNIPYYKNNMTADFRIKEVLIEFLGLYGSLKSYDNLVVRKKKLWKEKGLKVIEIYPKDLFPKNRLDEILLF